MGGESAQSTIAPSTNIESCAPPNHCVTTHRSSITSNAPHKMLHRDQASVTPTESKSSANREGTHHSQQATTMKCPLPLKKRTTQAISIRDRRWALRNRHMQLILTCIAVKTKQYAGIWPDAYEEEASQRRLYKQNYKSKQLYGL